ncbi:hypothetical protein [Nocardioides sp. B-3]|uniref:hypothetical protein n=1 Tax=Nocardioides sp. B-3 TaxID=2895565 RepID=UPI0021530E12|nr:hypothetical protein [Nocardioides sp. B-3]UUZ61110.1 hypothetical protein LP418_11000 [Nocardioides sp. B-3]
MPTEAEMRIASGALEKEATKWDAEAPALTTIAGTISGPELTRTEAGLFQIMFSAYETCRSRVEDCAREGAAEFTTMADTLTEISKAFKDLDAERAESVARLKW